MNKIMIPNKLWIRLTLAFGLVTVVGIIIAAGLANWQVSRQFRRFVAYNQIMDPALTAGLADYYAQTGSWVGVETVLDYRHGWGGMGGPGPGPRRVMPMPMLADAAGQVVYDPSGQRLTTGLSRSEQADAVPIRRQGQIVGYLITTAPTPDELTGPALAFLFQLNRSLLQAGLIAGGLGVLLGLAIARGLSAPLGRLATAARRISQGELDHRVPVKGSDEMANLAQAFNEMTASLQQAETMRRNLVADVAHELRTPLTVIQGNLQAILEDVYPMEKAEIAAIYDETLMLSRLVDDLRELAQAEAGRLSLNLQPIELTPLIERAAGLFEELAQDKQISLTVTLPATLPPVLADPDRVRQVLHNLLANALRHTPEGGAVHLSTVSPIPSSAGDQTAHPTTLVGIAVTDTGPGIAAQDLPHVFNRFWRADKSRSREHGGSGLGLAIAKQLVEAQGGQIGVESEGMPGRGSRFWFTLPLA